MRQHARQRLRRGRGQAAGGPPGPRLRITRMRDERKGKTQSRPGYCSSLLNKRVGQFGRSQVGLVCRDSPGTRTNRKDAIYHPRAFTGARYPEVDAGGADVGGVPSAQVRVFVHKKVAPHLYVMELHRWAHA